MILLRATCLAALTASAALTADALHPDRAFCPLEAACALARSSALGTILGLPTSVFGILAFLGLFLLTLLPVRIARVAARPAAWLAALMGFTFVVYQAFWLRSFCPLCLVADVSALAAGAAAFLWQPTKPPRSRRKGRPPGESSVARLRWATVAGLAVTVPLLWPHAERPSYVVRSQVAALDPELDTPPVASHPLPPPPPPPTTRARPLPEAVRVPPVAPYAPFPAAPPDPTPAPATPPPLPPAPPVPPPMAPPVPPAVDAPGVRPPSVGRTDPEPPPRRAPPPPRAPAPPPEAIQSPPPEPAPAAPPARRAIVMIEYLNPFCAHCRATHARLERVIASFEVPVQRQRVYVWSGRQPPYWAHACACAGAQGLEEALFAELLQTPRDDRRSVDAAVQRAGLDLQAFADCLGSETTQARLERNKRAMTAAQIEGLPTIDIGRRRLMGEQSEGELLDALRAAAADTP